MFGHIILPLDGSVLAECSLPHAAALARTFNSKITLLRVLEGVSFDGAAHVVDPLAWEIRGEEAGAYLSQWRDWFQKEGLDAEIELLDGPPAQRIVEYVHRVNADLIVLSSHGRSGHFTWSISGVAQKITAGVNISTMIVRAFIPVTNELSGLRYRRVLVPLDGSQRAEHFLPVASALAQAQGSRLLLAHVVRKPELPCGAYRLPEDEELSNRLLERNRDAGGRYLEELASRLPGEVKTRLVISDDVSFALHQLEEEEPVDLIVLSAHGSSGQRRWPFGSVTTNLISYGRTPLLIAQDLSLNEFEPTFAELTARQRPGH